MAVSYRVENQAGERVGVENHPGSGYSGRQCRPLKGFMGDVVEMGAVDCFEDKVTYCGLNKENCGLNTEKYRGRLQIYFLAPMIYFLFVIIDYGNIKKEHQVSCDKYIQ